MGSDKPNHNDHAGELHGEIIRVKAQELRTSQRDLALIYHQRGWEPANICRALDVDLDTLERLLAVDGRLRCTECAFARHDSCSHFYSDHINIVRCECYCRSGAS